MLAIDLDALAAAGKTALLLDVDNTLLPRDRTEVPDDLLAWARALPGRGFSVMLVSNNWHDVIFDHAQTLGFGIVAKAMKPFPLAFRKAMRHLGVGPAECVVVGDQLLTDVLGGRLAGASTILVEPLAQTDLRHTLVLRKLERVILNGQRPEA